MNHIVKFNAIGGIFTPRVLQDIVEIAYSEKVENINFGPRQEIYLNVKNEYILSFQNQLHEKNISYELDKDEYPNIVSSYVAESILSPDNWLTEGIYKDIFDQFDFDPKLKVNICDSVQTLVPFFSGELNFIASETYQYWYLYLNFEGQENVILWNRLIYTTDIPKICKEIEELFLNNKITDGNQIMATVNENTIFLFENITKDLKLPRFVFPYYEGMVKYGDKYWLGVYRRDYLYPIPFIFELCKLCNHTDIGQLCITPWRTLIVKGIESKDRIYWEKILGKHGINLRHSSNELNWIVDDINSEEIEIKKHIIRAFDKDDVRTFGLVFGIKLNPSKFIPASIIIEKCKTEDNSLPSFDIYYSDNFNPNNPNKNIFAHGIYKNELSAKLLELSKKFFSNLNEIEKSKPIGKNVISKTTPEKIDLDLHQCLSCFTVYDERFGDEMQGIKKGIKFENLPISYCCPTCETPKNKFIKINIEKIMNNT